MFKISSQIETEKTLSNRLPSGAGSSPTRRLTGPLVVQAGFMIYRRKSSADAIGKHCCSQGGIYSRIACRKVFYLRLSSVITSKPAMREQVKTGHRRPSGTKFFYPAAGSAGKSVFVRQLRGPHFSRCPWWRRRSRKVQKLNLGQFPSPAISAGCKFPLDHESLLVSGPPGSTRLTARQDHLQPAQVRCAQGTGKRTGAPADHHSIGARLLLP